MAIPALNSDGVLPPFVGPGPGGLPQNMTPYAASPLDVVAHFGTTPARRNILRGWLGHRSELLNRGLVGFQWLDGSFVENKDPRDLDVMTFVRRPAGSTDDLAWQAFVHANHHLLERDQVRAHFSLDAFFLDLDGDSTTLADTTAYFFGLFSHQRGTFIWKGMLKVQMEDIADNAAAIAAIDALDAAAGP